MGKWAEVACVCADRVPLENNDYSFHRPYRGKHRLTKLQREQLEQWELSTLGMYRCGHRHGMVVELWPGEIILVSGLAAKIFSNDELSLGHFEKVSDWRNYEDELLIVTPGEALEWLVEWEKLERAIQGDGGISGMGVHKLFARYFAHEIAERAELLERLDRPGAIKLRLDFANSSPPTALTAENKLLEAIANAKSLCNASIQTGNPIRFLW